MEHKQVKTTFKEKRKRAASSTIDSYFSKITRAQPHNVSVDSSMLRSVEQIAVDSTPGLRTETVAQIPDPPTSTSTHKADTSGLRTENIAQIPDPTTPTSTHKADTPGLRTETITQIPVPPTPISTYKADTPGLRTETVAQIPVPPTPISTYKADTPGLRTETITQIPVPPTPISTYKADTPGLRTETVAQIPVPPTPISTYKADTPGLRTETVAQIPVPPTPISTYKADTPGLRTETITQIPVPPTPISTYKADTPGLRTETVAQIPVPPTSTSTHKADIGLYIKKLDTLDDYTKRLLVEEPWIPPKDYVFPYSVHMKQGKTEHRFIQRSHLDAFDWLVYSDVSKGLYCKYCALFVASETGSFQTNTQLNTFVKTPLTSFAKLTGKDGALNLHASRKYHINAVKAGQEFLARYYKSEIDVANQVSSQRLAQVTENRERLRPVIDTIILCGRQNISLRGHRDDGRITLTEPLANEGNFRALLRYRASGDKNLQNQLESASAGTMYTSKTIQNELIDCIREEIIENLVNRVKKAGMYSIMFDETTDIAHMEQLSLSLRYVYAGKIREDFITFIDAYNSIREEDMLDLERRLTGEALGHIVVDLLHKMDLPLETCVGIGTDNCSVMASDVKGAVQEIIKSCPNAKRCPCINHSLNNSLARTSKVVPARNAITTMKSVINFARASSKRISVFKQHMKQAFSGLCETRWGERHDGVMQFRESCPNILRALQEITKWKDSKTSSDAYSLIRSLCNSEFIIAMICLSDMLSVTRPLSLILQTSDLDLQRATEKYTDTLNVLEKSRNQSDAQFTKLFVEASNTAGELGSEISLPRIAVRQTYRSNYASGSAEAYYRSAIFIPLLDNVIRDLKDRLPPETLMVFNLNIMMPSVIIKEDGDHVDAVKRLAAEYKNLLGPHAAGVLGEYKIWEESLKRLNRDKPAYSAPKSVLDVLDLCSDVIYPAVHRLILIMATLPVSVATSERSFSTLRRLRTWLRSTMAEDRLTGLALLHIHFDIPVDKEKNIDRFAKKKHRKLPFVI